MTGTDVGGGEGVCMHGFHMHSSVGIFAGRRVNLMAVEKGRRNKTAVGGMRMGRREDGVGHQGSPDMLGVVRIGAKDTRHLREKETCLWNSPATL